MDVLSFQVDTILTFLDIQDHTFYAVMEADVCDVISQAEHLLT
jgi:hypothetical protein